jgi:hypothetical protein
MEPHGIARVSRATAWHDGCSGPVVRTHRAFVLERAVLVLLSLSAGCLGCTASNAGSTGSQSPGGADASGVTGAQDGEPDSQATSATGDAAASGDDAGGSSCGDGGLHIPPLVDAAPCTPGQLVAATPVTIVTPDPAPSNPTLASSPFGDRFLAVWTDGGETINGTPIHESIRSSLVQPSRGGVVFSAAVELTGSGHCPVAAWNGTDFTVVWGDDSGMRSQEIDKAGTLVGSPAQVLSKANANVCPASLVAGPGGLAVAWYEGQSAYTENVGQMGPGGAIGSQVLLDTVGPGVSPNAALAQLGGNTYAAFVEWPDGSTSNTIVSAIDWSRQTALAQAVEPGFFGSFLAAGDELWLTAGHAAATVYAGAPGAPFRTIGASCTQKGWSIATDACGRLVQLGIGGHTPAGVATVLFAQPLGWTSAGVPLGNVTGSAIAGAASTFGVLWYARIGPGIPEVLDAQTSGSLSFTTLSWSP